MPAHVELKALVIFGAGQAADFVRFFDHDRRQIELGQLIGRGQPGRAGADNDDLLVGKLLLVHGVIFRWLLTILR